MAAGQRKAKGGPKAAETAGPLALTGWVMFDWATQPFYTLVVTFLFAPYFVNGFIKDPALGATLWAYATGGAELIAAILAPILGSIADAGFPRKPWIAGFSVLLVSGLCGLWLAVPGETGMAPLVLLSFALAIIGAELACGGGGARAQQHGQQRGKQASAHRRRSPRDGAHYTVKAKTASHRWCW